MNEEIRVRFAPSPTGFFHIGNARTALVNWLFAKSLSGKFILRIEDTDRERSKDEYLADITDGLSWLGLDWDEGPERKDGYGPYSQSERLPTYKKYSDELLSKNLAYNCYCTPEELAKEREEQEAKKLPPKYSGKCRDLSEEQIRAYQDAGRKPAVRFKVEPQKVSFKDLVKGDVEFDSALFGDFVIMRSDGLPTFMFAGAVDDYLMKISHVIRGEDHLSNTPRQILLSQALNFLIPEYGHLPMILNPDRTKLSKRKNPTSLSKDFRDKGYLPQAMVNFMVLMGWAAKSGEEFWQLKDLIHEFNLEDMGKSPSIFDIDKLNFLNGYYIRKMPLGDLAKAAEPFLTKAGLADGRDKLLTALSLVQDRVKRLADTPDLIEFFFKAPEDFEEILVAQKSNKDETKKALQSALAYLEKEDDYSQDSLEQLLRAVAKKENIPAGNILWPIRVALTGRQASPGTFEVLEALGKDESLKRIKRAIDMLR